MKRIITSKKSKKFNEQAEELSNIFHDKKHFGSREVAMLNKLGYIVEFNNKHYKVYLGEEIITTLSSTSSDRNVGNQAIRQFRRFWESKGE